MYILQVSIILALVIFVGSLLKLRSHCTHRDQALYLFCSVVFGLYSLLWCVGMLVYGFMHIDNSDIKGALWTYISAQYKNAGIGLIFIVFGALVLFIAYEESVLKTIKKEPKIVLMGTVLTTAGLIILTLYLVPIFI